MKGIKRLIFDFDNTLILWKDEYVSALQDTMDEYQVDCRLEDLNKAIGETAFYEFSKMTVSNAIRQAKNLCTIDIDEAFIHSWLKKVGERTIDLEDDVIDTLDYLYKKYSLVVLSNFLGSVQKDRAEHANIARYFEAFYGSNDGKMKPHPNSYVVAIGPYKIEECIMIGDSRREDIEGAKSIGLKSIHLDRKGKYETSDEQLVIHKISDLKDIL